MSRNKEEAIKYIFWGLLTTAINIISYAILTKILKIDYMIATSIAWVLSVVFAFITNRLYVFKSYKKDLISVLIEFISFTFFRVLSYFLDILTMILLVKFIGIDDFVAKLATNILVIIFNYFASKYIVFKKQV
jgi:putative flippase GtrA